MTGTGTFYLLGAGFSKAMSPNMPLLNELRDAVLPRLDISRDGRLELGQFGQNFESWLSYLAVAQPWLTDSENFRNQALFLEASQQVSDVIREAQTAVLQERPKEWLVRLLVHWSNNSDDLCTFNYDTLIESGLVSLGYVSALSDIYRISLAQRWPPGSSGFLSSGAPPGPVPWIYKLHGSINWAYGGPHAPVSDQVTLVPSHSRWSVAPESAAERPRRDQVMHDDLLPLIIPPTTTKGDFYGNLSLRAQWRRAFQSLRSSERLTVIGYSFPAGDLQARQFIASAARHASVTVVDVSSTAGATVQQILGDEAAVTTYDGDSCVADFVNATCAPLLRWETVMDSTGWPTPKITLDGEDVTYVCGDEWTSGQYDDAQNWMNKVIDRRWPGVRDKAKLDPWVQPNTMGWGANGMLAPVS